jgi:phage gp36-like protein
MPYCTKQDLIDRFSERELIQLTDRTNSPASTIDDVVVDRALGDATALIDGYLGKVYTLPLATIPEMLVKLSADIARFYLHGKGVEKDSPIRTAYNDAVAYLRDVAKGLIQLIDVGSGDTPPAAGGGQVQVISPPKIFSRDSLRDY